MRIDFNRGSEPLVESSRSSVQNSSAAQNASRANTLGSSALAEDQAQLSGAHVQLQALAAQAAHFPEVREERVQALRQAIEGGQYHASPENVARALVVHMTAKPAA